MKTLCRRCSKIADRGTGLGALGEAFITVFVLGPLAIGLLFWRDLQGLWGSPVCQDCAGPVLPRRRWDDLLELEEAGFWKSWGLGSPNQGRRQSDRAMAG